MRDFIGLNVHTVQFKPQLMRRSRGWCATTIIDWDIGKDVSRAATFPRAQNGVDWKQLYGSWRRDGFRINACLIFEGIEPAAWKDGDAAQYGRDFARAFGPSAADPLVEAVEIGNEPSKYDDATYRAIFEAMARAVRETDPKLRIATCAANLGPSGKYSKSVDALKGLEALYDIVNVHFYARPNRGRPSAQYRGSAIDFLTNARVSPGARRTTPDKEIWVTSLAGTHRPSPRPRQALS